MKDNTRSISDGFYTPRKRHPSCGFINRHFCMFTEPKISEFDKYCFSDPIECTICPLNSETMIQTLIENIQSIKNLDFIPFAVLVTPDVKKQLIQEAKEGCALRLGLDQECTELKVCGLYIEEVEKLPPDILFYLVDEETFYLINGITRCGMPIERTTNEIRSGLGLPPLPEMELPHIGNPTLYLGEARAETDIEEKDNSADGREDTEQQLIDILRHTPSDNLRALILESYIQQYGPVSDENGEIIRQILEENA